MFARTASAAALLAAAAFAAPTAAACDVCGNPYHHAAPVAVAHSTVTVSAVSVAPVVDPCCEPPAPTLRERIAARRIARLERRADRIRDRAFADDCCDGYGYGHAAGYGTPYGGYGHAGLGYGGSGYGGYGYGY